MKLNFALGVKTTVGLWLCASLAVQSPVPASDASAAVAPSTVSLPDTSFASNVISQLQNALNFTSDPSAKENLEQQIAVWKTVGFYQQLEALEKQQQQQSQLQTPNGTFSATGGSIASNATATESNETSAASQSNFPMTTAATSTLFNESSASTGSNQTVGNATANTIPGSTTAAVSNNAFPEATNTMQQIAAIQSMNSISGLQGQIDKLKRVYEQVNDRELREAVKTQVYALEGFELVLAMHISRVEYALQNVTEEPVRIWMIAYIFVLQHGEGSNATAAGTA
ncbi:hypothetical protein HDU84_003753 [Entophlyctis sp. JEL0112]|nr:hypothetical protein HDU84_003753 [Entophlyctis sp. JEL0112]